MHQYEPEDSRRLFIGGLKRQTTEATLKAVFQKYGETVEVEVKRDRVTGQSRGFGFITYARSSMVDKAVGFRIVDGKIVEAKRLPPRNNIRKPPGGWINIEDADVDEKYNLIPQEYLNKFKFIDYTQDDRLNSGYGSVDQLPGFCKEATPALAMDCEMVGVGPMKASAVARVSIVNEYGFCIFDSFVKPDRAVTDYRTKVSGIREEDLLHGISLTEARLKVTQLIKGKILVGHSVDLDLEALSISHPQDKIRDTSVYFTVPGNKQTPSLKQLADKLLKMEIQRGEHSSIQDAQATMKIYVIYRNGWEKSLEH